MRGHRGYNICPWLKSGKRETYGAPFVNLLFNLFLEDFLVIYYLIYDN